jgi:outer membrane protein OmpA-like peptidoglycan-associated protein
MKKTALSIAAATILLGGCASMNKQQQGTAAGAAGGALLGAAVSKGSIWGILAGAAIGGAAGNLIGKKMDKQAQELQQAIPSAEVQRVGEGINMTFNSGLMFAKNSSEINESYKKDLAAAAAVFVKYPDTHLVIEGHTDDSGSDEVNMRVSEARAKSVAKFFQANGVDVARIQEKWYGESQPKYPNDTEENRIKNRRVEIAVVANENMKKQAQEGTLKE